MTDQTVLEGFISVDAALRGASRDVLSIMIRQDKEDRDTQRLERAAQAKRVPVKRVAVGVIDAQASGKSHGGIIAHVGSRRFVALEALLPSTVPAFIVMIDGVEDPFNFGAAVRSLYAAGADGLVVRPRNWMSAAGTVARASAGASELIPMAIAETAAEAADFFRSQGLTIACATADPPTLSLYQADLTQPLFLLIGGEKRGITRSFLDQADLRVQIPYGRPQANSLGTAAAAAVLAFELLRQRQPGPLPMATPKSSHAAPSLRTQSRRRPLRGS